MSTPSNTVRTVAIVTLAFGLLAGGPAIAQSSVGVVFDGPAPEGVAVANEPWARVEVDAVRLGWDTPRAQVASFRDAGFRVAICLPIGRELPAATEVDAIESWRALVRTAVLNVAPSALAVGCSWDPSWNPEAYAYLLKQTSLAVRVAARESGREVLILPAALPAGDRAIRQRLWAADIAPYVDVVPIVVEPGVDPTPAVAVLTVETASHPPAPGIWTLHPAEPGDPWAAAAAAVRALASGAGTALYGSWDDGSEAALWASNAQDVFASYSPALVGNVALEPAPGTNAGGEILGRFVENETFASLVFYRDRGAERDPTAASPGSLHLVVRGAVTEAMLLDPRHGEERVLPTIVRDAASRALVLPRVAAPTAARFRIATPGLDREEQLDVAGTRSLTAEEIIARHQETRTAEDEHLERWTARGRIDLHFRLAQAGASVDVSIDCNYFWRRGGQLEWEQTDYYVNGNRVRWKNIPELPLIQPEKVVTLPLDLHLDKSYAYRILGEERVRDRNAWVLSFEPIDPEPGRSLYRGRVWIDQADFTRLRVALLQTGMEPPVLSNEETDSYEPHTDAEGRRYVLLSRTNGEQVWTVAGRSFVVQREVSFADFEINPPVERFEERLGQAYASAHQMLRDTDAGFRYLERTEEGGREVKEAVDTEQFFAAAGAFGDSSTDGVRPIAGVNWFDYDLWGKNIQLNALFGGVVAFVTLSKPDLFGSRIDGTIDVAGMAIAFDDNVFRGDREIIEERIASRTQRMSLRVGFPIATFFKAIVVGSLAHRDYTHDDDGDEAVGVATAQNPGTALDFELPADHLETTGRLDLEYNRRGLSAGVHYAQSHRSEWERWGLRDLAVGPDAAVTVVDGVVVPVAPAVLEDGFAHWGASAAIQWFLPKFQKVRANVDWLDGDRLDRFSRYQFGMFGDDRLSGFSGSGVRFDDGVIGRAGYSFNLFEAIRFDATVESARVRLDEPGAEAETHTGVGLGGNLVGPWKTVWTVSWGYALASDIPDLEGEQEFYLLVLKLF